MWRVKVTHIYVCDGPITFLLMPRALRALQKPGQLQHSRNTANIIHSPPYPYPHSNWNDSFFFFSAKPCKVAKAGKPGTWAYAGGKQAYSSGPRAHQVQKHEARLGLCGGSGDERSWTICTDKSMIKIIVKKKKKLSTLGSEYTVVVAERGQWTKRKKKEAVRCPG